MLDVRGMGNLIGLEGSRTLSAMVNWMMDPMSRYSEKLSILAMYPLMHPKCSNLSLLLTRSVQESESFPNAQLVKRTMRRKPITFNIIETPMNTELVLTGAIRTTS